jgi:osmotically-inducible protein OsmY
MANRWEEPDRSDFRDERRYPDRDRDDRGIVNRAGDEVRSWFGDDDAARRRHMDEVRDDRHDREWRDRPGRSMQGGWERTREAVRHVTDRDRDGRRGMAEWNDNDRGSLHPSEPRPSYGSSLAWRDDRSSADAYRGDPRWNGPSQAGWQSRPEMGYSGRGPRGYQRGDERIREDICERLTEDSRIDASDVDVVVSNGEVTLTGSVRTREEKHSTETVVERIMGVREVNNNLKVRPPDEVLGTARSGASMLGLNETPPPEPLQKKSS